jgi:putative GTP pyrophosphokinase
MASKEVIPTETAIDKAAISATYNERLRVYEALLEEICFILDEEIKAEDIKIHTIEKRVKTLDSLLEKCSRKSCADPFSSFDDIAAARVICLFRSDIQKLKLLLEKSFLVEDIDDKLVESENSLGYLSIHFRCKMRPEYAGPRYQKIADIPFEIQVRTLCMHCWAAVSHYLDYKGDWDVPANLKRGLSALSGLFYVADDEFEQFYAARAGLKKEATTQADLESPDEEINLDTIVAYLERKFSDHKRSDSGAISEFVKELKDFGYKTVGEVNRDIDRAIDVALEFESKEREAKYHSVGIARAALDLASPQYREKRSRGDQYGNEYYRKVKAK